MKKPSKKKNSKKNQNLFNYANIIKKKYKNKIKKHTKKKIVKKI